jgi:hypothetical protein
MSFSTNQPEMVPAEPGNGSQGDKSRRHERGLVKVNTLPTPTVINGPQKIAEMIRMVKDI